MPVLPVVENSTIVLPVGELAGQGNIGRALPFLALALSREYRIERFTSFFPENRELELPSPISPKC